MAEDTVYSELDRYLETTPRSREMWEEAKRYLPGGDTRNSIFWAPYPVYIQDGSGCHAVDLDGTDRLDFIGNMTSLPLGNAYPPVVKAVQEQAARGLVYNAPNEHQVRLARLLCRRVPSVELVRFTNSGTEATLNAVRAARAFTGRTKIAKCEGGYHGTHDVVSVSVRTDPAMGGSPERPTAVPSVAGLPPSVVEEVVVMPFNDTAAARAILEDNAGELAAVIVEPVLGGSGMVPADQEYLDALREFTEVDGSVLIFDEVISFRASHGGAQEHYGIRPDMTTFGKIIGGGFAVGAFGGRRDLMDLYDPDDGSRRGPCRHLQREPHDHGGGRGDAGGPDPRRLRPAGASYRGPAPGRPGRVRRAGRPRACDGLGLPVRHPLSGPSRADLPRRTLQRQGPAPEGLLGAHERGNTVHREPGGGCVQPHGTGGGGRLRGGIPHGPGPERGIALRPPIPGIGLRAMPAPPFDAPSCYVPYSVI